MLNGQVKILLELAVACNLKLISIDLFPQDSNIKPYPFYPADIAKAFDVFKLFSP